MSGIEKKIVKIVKIAQNSSNESAFQKNDDYMKFKSMKLKSAYSLDINHLIMSLELLHFQEECIYWYKRLLKITDMCNKEARHEIFWGIIKIYMAKQEHGLVLQYGKEALENAKGTNLPKHFQEFEVGSELLRLEKYRDALPYFNSENLNFFTNPQASNQFLAENSMVDILSLAKSILHIK